MALYQYIKAQPSVIKQSSPGRGRSGARTFVSTILGVAGLFLIVWVAYPIVSFEITSRFKYEHSDALPNSDTTQKIWNQLAQNEHNVKSKSGGGVVLAQTKNSDDPTRLDYTKASNWFPNMPQSQMALNGRIYYLSIPKLKIKDAIVTIAGDDLNRSLIHYGGTGLPGDYGTAVIFGHSILPQFYDPKNYKSIFSLLPKLSEEDELFVTYDGVTYRYRIIDMHITPPDDVSVLEQKYDSSYVRLITCVPPGTYWKRLAVTARLETM